MLALEDADRRRALHWSAALCLGSLLLAPLAARSSVDLGARELRDSRVLQMPVVEATETAARLSVLRDPFAADAIPALRAPEDSETGTVPANAGVGMRVRSGDPIALPQNPSAGEGPMSAAFVGTTVLAVITGDRAEALVSDGSSSRIIAVGDRLNGREVKGITAEGIRLDDGTTLALAEQTR